MARFNDLNESDRIRAIKDNFISILGQVASAPEDLKEFIDMKRPDEVKPAIKKVVGNSEEAASIEVANALAIEKAKADNNKLAEEYAKRETMLGKIKEAVSKIEKKEACICGGCFNINVLNAPIPDEFELLIEAARKQAEKATY